MDNPVPPQKPRWVVRWFSPLRWRFWVLVFPLLAILVLLFLFAWPGLVYEWSIAKGWGIRRHHYNARFDIPLGFTIDRVELEAGPFHVAKLGYTYAGEAPADRASKGFSTQDEPSYWVLDYESYNLKVRVVVNKEWSPW